MAMFRGFNPASRAQAPNLLAAKRADEADEAAKLKRNTDMLLGAVSLGSAAFAPAVMPAIAGGSALMGAGGGSPDVNLATALRNYSPESQYDMASPNFGNFDFLPNY